MSQTPPGTTKSAATRSRSGSAEKSTSGTIIVHTSEIEAMVRKNIILVIPLIARWTRGLFRARSKALGVYIMGGLHLRSRSIQKEKSTLMKGIKQPTEM
jgi:hypothetical protein